MFWTIGHPNMSKEAWTMCPVPSPQARHFQLLTCCLRTSISVIISAWLHWTLDFPEQSSGNEELSSFKTSWRAYVIRWAHCWSETCHTLWTPLWWLHLSLAHRRGSISFAVLLMWPNSFLLILCTCIFSGFLSFLQGDEYLFILHYHNGGINVGLPSSWLIKERKLTYMPFCRFSASMRYIFYQWCSNYGEDQKDHKFPFLSNEPRDWVSKPKNWYFAKADVVDSEWCFEYCSAV